MAKHAGGRPVKWAKVEDMQTAIDAYFAECDARTVPTVVGKGKDRVLIDVPKPAPYIVRGLALYLDLTWEGLLEYQRKPAFSESIKKAKLQIEVNKIQHMLDGDGYGQNCAKAFDCDDNDAAINPGAVELCNRIDDNCNNIIDEYLVRDCGISNIGRCKLGSEQCINGEWAACNAILPSEEVCENSIDDN